MACFIAIGLNHRHDRLDRMCLPIVFEDRERAQRYLGDHPSLYRNWGAMFSYGEIEIDDLWLSNWGEWCERNHFYEDIDQ